MCSRANGPMCFPKHNAVQTGFKVHFRAKIASSKQQLRGTRLVMLCSVWRRTTLSDSCRMHHDIIWSNLRLRSSNLKLRASAALGPHSCSCDKVEPGICTEPGSVMPASSQPCCSSSHRILKCPDTQESLVRLVVCSVFRVPRAARGALRATTLSETPKSPIFPRGQKQPYVRFIPSRPLLNSRRASAQPARH